MFDTDKFIECVHEKPALWDKHLHEYSNKNERDKCWVLIGESMFSDWPEIDEKEKDARVQDMKKMWRHIRDSYARYLNQSKSGSAAPEKKKKYVYADALTFLMNTMEKRRTSGNISDSVQDDFQEEEAPDDIVPGDEVHQATLEQPQAKEKRTRPSMENNKRKAATKLSSFQIQLLSQLSKSTAAEEDPDRLYILSLLEDYKKLNEDEKLDFKLMNLQYFRSARQRKSHQCATSQPPQTTNPSNQYTTSGQLQPLVQPWSQDYGYPRPKQAPVHQSPYESVLSPSDSVYSYNSEGLI